MSLYYRSTGETTTPSSSYWNSGGETVREVVQAQVHQRSSSHIDLPISIIGARLAGDLNQPTTGDLHPLADTPMSCGSSMAASSSFGEPLAAAGGRQATATTLEEDSEEYGGPASSSTSFSLGTLYSNKNLFHVITAETLRREGFFPQEL